MCVCWTKFKLVDVLLPPAQTTHTHTHLVRFFVFSTMFFFWFCHSFFLVFYLVAQFNFVENRCRRRRPFLLLLSSFIWIQLDIILMKQEWEKKTAYILSQNDEGFVFFVAWELRIFFCSFKNFCISVCVCVCVCRKHGNDLWTWTHTVFIRLVC